jgi:diguanylate cyclase (GGDEF)-like protein/PAS domain S-box-containing protein
MFQYTLYILLAPAAAAGSLAVAAYSWRSRTSPGAVPLTFYLLAVCGFLITNILELITITPQATLFWVQMEYIFITLLPVTWMAFAFQFSGQQRWLSGQRFWLFFIVPAVTILLVFSNNLHHLIWQGYTFKMVNMGLTMRVGSYGTWFWMYSAYAYGLFLAGFILILRAYIQLRRVDFWRESWVLVGSVLSLGVNAIYIFRLMPGLEKDYTPLGFAFLGFAFAVAIFRYGLFDLMPVARTTLVDKMSDAVILIDRNQRIVDLNPAARMILARVRFDPIGRNVSEIKFLAGLLGYWRDKNNHPFEFTFQTQDGKHFYDARITRLVGKHQSDLGSLITLHDITEHKRLLENVEKLAICDPLTGLYNRRHFLHLAQLELERSRRYHYPVSIILVDLDWFKQINDTYGHVAGDRVLETFSRRLNQSVREVDLLARFGGEEFMILLPQTDLQGASVIAERVRSCFDNEPVVLNAIAIPITVSIGVTTYSSYGNESLVRLFERVDQALYESKAKGRNQVSVWTDTGL